jgi:hypothetical protein
MPSCLIPRSNRLAFACLFICMLVSSSDASEFEKSQQKNIASESTMPTLEQSRVRTFASKWKEHLPS